MKLNLKPEIKKYRANGKLLISGEYTVLDGGLAFAIPTKFGQTLEVKSENSDGQNRTLFWEAYLHDDSLWFSAEFSLDDLSTISTTDKSLALKLQSIFQAIEQLNPMFFKTQENSIYCKTKLEFPKDWGLGSSSTLVYILAKFARVDEFDLSDLTFKTSGYDIACAGNDHPILYQKKGNKRRIEKVEFHPKFLDKLYFLYLNKKQDTQRSVSENYKSKPKNDILILQISKITKQLISADNLSDFEKLVEKHEELLSIYLDFKKVKKIYFTDYEGFVKSLGAWGGDFVMLTERKNFVNYFQSKGYSTIISFQEMIKNN